VNRAGSRMRRGLRGVLLVSAKKLPYRVRVGSGVTIQRPPGRNAAVIDGG
jgi:hypothetical protein